MSIQRELANTNTNDVNAFRDLLNIIMENLADKYHHLLLNSLFSDFCNKGRVDMVEMLICFSGRILNYHHGFLSACEGGHYSLAIFLLAGLALHWSPTDGVDVLTEGLQSACEGGNTDIIYDILAKLKQKTDDASYMNRGLYGACRGGHLDVARLILNEMLAVNVVPDWNDGHVGACEKGHPALAELMIHGVPEHIEHMDTLATRPFRGGADNFDVCIEVARDEGQLEMVKLMELHGATYYPDIMYELCSSNNVQGVNEIIATGQEANWEIGFQGACHSGNMELIALMMTKMGDHPYDWHEGLGFACEGGQATVVNMMIEKIRAAGETPEWNDGLHSACVNGKVVTARMMIDGGADNLEYCMEVACEHAHLNIIALLLDATAIE